ncbi:hypothetical protein GG344DRAFT_68605 [Lentinula edodes]|nr:hypothetical protein GG344DRAFT_68605 [Lentinula edodes]
MNLSDAQFLWLLKWYNQATKDHQLKPLKPNRRRKQQSIPSVPDTEEIKLFYPVLTSVTHDSATTGSHPDPMDSFEEDEPMINIVPRRQPVSGASGEYPTYVPSYSLYSEFTHVSSSYVDGFDIQHVLQQQSEMARFIDELYVLSRTEPLHCATASAEQPISNTSMHYFDQNVSPDYPVQRIATHYTNPYFNEYASTSASINTELYIDNGGGNDMTSHQVAYAGENIFQPSAYGCDHNIGTSSGKEQAGGGAKTIIAFDDSNIETLFQDSFHTSVIVYVSNPFMSQQRFQRVLAAHGTQLLKSNNNRDA